MFFRETLRGIPLPTRQAQRRREGTSGAIPAFVPDGATLIRPTGASHKLLYPRPGKRSAAGQDTADTVPVFVPDGATLIRPTKCLYCRPDKVFTPSSGKLQAT